MIPQEKIDHAANVANDYTQPMNIDAFNDGFNCGVGFAESELSKPKVFEIDFAGNVKAKFEVNNGEINIIAAINGYGDAIDPDQIIITQIEQ